MHSQTSRQVLGAALAAAITLLVAALVLDDGQSSEVVIFGIAGGVIGWLAVGACD